MNSKLHFSSPPYLDYFFSRYPYAKCDLASSGRKERSWAELEPFLSGIQLYEPRFKVAEHAFRDAILERYGLASKVDLLPVPGTSSANFITLNALSKPGDTVVVETPVYDPIPFAAAGIGRHVKSFNRPLKDNFVPNLDEIDSLLSQGVTLLFITNHHNPSGIFLDTDVLKQIDLLLDKHNALGVVDEVYLEFRSSWRQDTILNFSNRMVVTSSLTKVYGLGELRAGWIVGNPELVERCRCFWNLMAVNSPAPGLLAARALLAQLDAWYEKDMRSLAENRAIFDNWRTNASLDAVENGLSPIVLLKLPNGVDDVKLADTAFEHFGLFLIPCSFFGLNNYLRLGLFKPKADLEKGLNLLQKAIGIEAEKS